MLLAELPLDALRKQYAGAYADGFEWPQPSPQSNQDDEETEGTSMLIFVVVFVQYVLHMWTKLFKKNTQWSLKLLGN